MRFVLFINNDEAEANGDNPDFDEASYEIGELLRSGYYDVELIARVEDD